MIYHILIIDDDEKITAGLQYIIERNFQNIYCVHTAHNGPDALRLLTQFPFALVITDVKMPGMSGLECLERIKQHQLPCETVLLSGHDDYSLIREGLRLSAYDYLLKPVHIDNFVRLIGEITQQLEGRIFRCADISFVSEPAMILPPKPEPYFDMIPEMPSPKEDLMLFLSSASDAVFQMNIDAAQIALRQFFDHASPSEISEEILKEALVQFVYSLMRKTPTLIGIFAKSKLTENDAINCIKNLPTLSQLRERLCAILGYYISALSEEHRCKDRHLIRKAKQYIHDHYMNELSLANVAAHLYLHPNYFSSLFKKETQVTFRDYVKTYRIDKAKEMIAAGETKLYTIAQQVGYPNANHFARAFKDVTGLLPSDFRNFYSQQK